MKIEGSNVINKSGFVHKGVVEAGRKNLKEASVAVDEAAQKPIEKKVFKNPEPSSLKGFNLDKLA